MSVVIDVFAKTFDYRGRARRKEYWIYALAMLLGAATLFSFEILFGWFDSDMGWGPLTGSLAVLTFPTSLAVAVRRLHDTGKSGWWYLIILIPFVGPVVLLCFMATAGTPGINKYGADPLANDNNSVQSADI
jgi:uncharacterized membrane protein YhaH (DUF805 family)